MHALLLLVGFLLVPSQAQNADVTTEKILLKNAEPSYVLQFLVPPDGPFGTVPRNLPADIRTVRANDSDMTVIATGTLAALTELKGRLNLLDIQPKRVRLDIRLLHNVGDLGGQPDVQVRRELNFTSYNNVPTVVTMPDWTRQITLSILPRANGDGSISLMIEAAVKFDPNPMQGGRAISMTTRFNRRLQPGEHGIFGVLPGRADSDAKDLAHFPAMVTDPKERAGYYVEVSAEILKDRRRPLAR